MKTFEIKDSGWTLIEILKLQLNVNKYISLRGNSYVNLPKWMKDKHVIINVKNKDNKYFLWSILLAIHPADSHSDRVSKYSGWENEFDEELKGIKFLVKIEYFH